VAFYVNPFGTEGPILEWSGLPPDSGWKLGLNEGRLSFEFRSDKQEPTRIRSHTPMKAGAWSHVVVTADGRELKLYVNGTPVGAASYPPPSMEFWKKIHLGWSVAAPDTWRGLLDELGFWTRALRPDEIQGMYAKRSQEPCKP
jgi:hypothetical protein